MTITKKKDEIISSSKDIAETFILFCKYLQQSSHFFGSLFGKSAATDNHIAEIIKYQIGQRSCKQT